MSASVPIAFQGELMLAGWTQSHNGGAKVSFWLSDDSDLDKFKHMTARKGKTAGQRLMAVLVEVDENEQPVPQSGEHPQAPKGGPLARSAALLCGSTEFQQFMRAGNVEEAASDLRTFCGVKSRAELDNDPTAARNFQRLMVGYRDWRRTQGLD